MNIHDRCHETLDYTYLFLEYGDAIMNETKQEHRLNMDAQKERKKHGRELYMSDGGPG